MSIWGVVRLAIVAAIIILSAMNASWIAPQPPGVLKLIAATGADACETTGSAQTAFVNSADYLVLSAKPGCLGAEEAVRQMPKRKFIASTDSGFAASVPAGWTWTRDAARACYDDYFKMGWLGIVPESCRGKTMLIPLDGQLKVWGWPKRFMARMNAAGVKVILGEPGKGVAKVQQLPEVPRDFTGYLWVEDIARIGPAIRR